MAEPLFTLRTQKRGRLVYLLLTMGIPLLVMEGLTLLLKRGILPTGEILSYIYAFLPILGIPVLGYFLILRKNHKIDVTDGALIETDWRQKVVCRIEVTQIHSFRRNLLREIILLNEDGKKLLCVEANMENFDQFEQWLEKHNKNKETSR